jgi:capsular exopolysaccharide synthesis family protein
VAEAPVTSASANQLKQEGSSVGIAQQQTQSQQQPDANSQGDKNTSARLVGSESEYLMAKQQIVLIKAQREELSVFLKPKHPKIIALDEQIAQMEKLLDIFRNQTQEQLNNLQHSLTLQIENLESDIKEWEIKSIEISRTMSKYQTLREETMRVQNMFDHLMTEDYSVVLDSGLAQQDVAVLEPPTPSRQSPPKLEKWMLLAIIVGMGLGMGVLLVIDHLDDRPSSLAELQEIVDEEILGQIPKIRNKDKKMPVPILHDDDDRHALVEAYRNLRSSIMFLGTPENHPKTILVTSAIPGDGKSMTTANLAITLAQAGGRVLLIDADLRRGVMHKHFSIETGPGLSEVLGEQAKWTDVIKPTHVPNLWLMPRGSTRRHPGELFVTSAKDKLLKTIESQYDYILFDTAPVMAADDVSNLAPHVDGVVMVIRATYTSGRVARAALDLLYQRKVNLLGVVFNAVRTNASEYYYYHYKDYYAKHSN